MPQTKTILIVDDDAEWREFVRTALCPPYAAQEAADGAEALRIARTTHPSVIVLDVVLGGGMDGFTTLCHLRKDPETQGIPVVMLSEVNKITDSAFNKDEIRRYLGVAPAAFLEKPVEPGRLRAEVERLMARGADEG